MILLILQVESGKEVRDLPSESSAFPLDTSFPLGAGQGAGPYPLSLTVSTTEISACSSQHLYHLSLPLFTMANHQLRCELPGAWATARICKLVSQSSFLPAPVHPVPWATALTFNTSYNVLLPLRSLS